MDLPIRPRRPHLGFRLQAKLGIQLARLLLRCKK